MDLIGVDVVWIVIEWEEVGRGGRGGGVEIKKVTNFMNKISSLTRGRVLENHQTRLIGDVMRLALSGP